MISPFCFNFIHIIVKTNLLGFIKKWKKFAFFLSLHMFNTFIVAFYILYIWILSNWKVFSCCILKFSCNWQLSMNVVIVWKLKVRWAGFNCQHTFPHPDLTLFSLGWVGNSHSNLSCCQLMFWPLTFPCQCRVNRSVSRQCSFKGSAAAHNSKDAQV